MKHACRFSGLMFLALLGAAAWGDHLPPVASPLLYVRIQGPQGMKVSFLEGPQLQRTFDAPVQVALRPGFGYRIKLEGFPNLPNVPVYASIEVGDTLQLPRRAKAADHPAPIYFSEDDFQAVLQGTMVKKVVVVENPDKVQTAPAGNIPGEVNVLPEQPLMERAVELGRPLALVYLGRREPDPIELAQQTPGNVLYPDMTCLPPMRHAAFPFRGFGRLEECMRDGGDNGDRAWFDAQGKLYGVDPSDSMATYRDSTGMRYLAVTNEVCLCVPRFVLARQLVPIMVAVGQNGAENQRQLKKSDQFNQREKLTLKRQTEEAEIERARQKPQMTITEEGPRRIVDMQMLIRTQMDLGPFTFLGTDRLIQLTERDKALLKRQVEAAIKLTRKEGTERVANQEGTYALGRVVGLGTVTGRMETRTQTFLCIPDKPAAPDQPLQIIKWVNVEAARIGDTVTFYIKYTNLGGRPIEDIAVVDSLTARLEYVPGSAKSDREAVFVMQDNDASSLLLRWEIKSPLPPGQSGVVSFQAKIK